MTDFFVTESQDYLVIANGDDYLDLVNDVLDHFSEVRLTSSTFASATGFHAVVKSAVNFAIREIQQAERQWPFNWSAVDQTVDPYQADPHLYSLPPDYETIDWDTFRLRRDDSLTVPETSLEYIDYDEWVDRYADVELATTGTLTSINLPARIFHYPDDKFGISPRPDRAYEIHYEYWVTPDDLTDYNDTTTIPFKYRHVIISGAIALCYTHREDPANYNIWNKRFKEGINKMRETLIDRSTKLRDNRVKR